MSPTRRSRLNWVSFQESKKAQTSRRASARAISVWNTNQWLGKWKWARAGSMDKRQIKFTN